MPGIDFDDAEQLERAIEASRELTQFLLMLRGDNLPVPPPEPEEEIPKELPAEEIDWVKPFFEAGFSKGEITRWLREGGAITDKETIADVNHLMVERITANIDSAMGKLKSRRLSEKQKTVKGAPGPASPNPE